MREVWDKVMIGLMVAVIVVCAQELLTSAEPFSETRCLFAVGGAGLVIFLKLDALKKARTNHNTGTDTGTHS